ncbi:hypothetical protein [Streptomyces sp. NPDC059455]|uniref:hypothetical protein n=1 Tax=Streptomyces sp. NPDC059455 TaxID=3346837 RepID=UPI0036AE4CD6
MRNLPDVRTEAPQGSGAASVPARCSGQLHSPTFLPADERIRDVAHAMLADYLAAAELIARRPDTSLDRKDPVMTTTGAPTNPTPG